MGQRGSPSAGGAVGALRRGSSVGGFLGQEQPVFGGVSSNFLVFSVFFFFFWGVQQLVFYIGFSMYIFFFFRCVLGVHGFSPVSRVWVIFLDLKTILR